MPARVSLSPTPQRQISSQSFSLRMFAPQSTQTATARDLMKARLFSADAAVPQDRFLKQYGYVFLGHFVSAESLADWCAWLGMMEEVGITPLAVPSRNGHSLYVRFAHGTQRDALQALLIHSCARTCSKVSALVWWVLSRRQPPP